MSQVKLEIDITNIAPSKLLHYLKKQDLIDFLGPQNYATVESKLFQQMGIRPTIKDLKQYLSKNPEFIQKLRDSNEGQRAFQAYMDAVNRLTNIDRTKINTIRTGMAEPRRRFVGCLATKLKPEDYTDCLQNYDDSSFDGIKIVPPALKTKVFENSSNPALKQALSTTVAKGNLSSIPQGLRHYINSNPSEFKQYYDERKQEMNLIRTVLKGMSPQEKERLKALYSQGSTIPREEFSNIFNPESVKKRVRGQGYRRIEDVRDNPDLNQFLFSSCLNDAKNSDLLSDTASTFGEELQD